MTSDNFRLNQYYMINFKRLFIDLLQGTALYPESNNPEIFHSPTLILITKI